MIPQGWQCQDHGKGTFVAGDSGGYSFISGNVDLLTPQMRVNQPGILVSPYLAPGQAWQFITARYGLASNMRFEKVIPRADMARQMGQTYTAGPRHRRGAHLHLHEQGGKSDPGIHLRDLLRLASRDQLEL